MKSDGLQTVHIRAPHCVAVGVTDPGLVRAENEDSVLLDEQGRYLMLADGMGGHERGAEASHTALGIIRDCLSPEDISAEMMDITAGSGVSPEVSCYLSVIELAVRKANSMVYDRNRQAGLQRYMGTTIVGLIALDEPIVMWFHVGDSRLYRLRENTFEQLTVDHSAHNEWLRGGKVGDEPGKNVITRAIGPNPAVSPEIHWAARKTDDLYLLCSDGLSDMLSDEEIVGILQNDADVEKTGHRLISAANNAGGKDNISVVLCRMVA
jgi:serine/threonine protein phosphatase PrpC